MKRRPYNKRTIPFRRKREQKTDYKQRMGLLLAKKPRLVVRKSNKHIQAQLVNYDVVGDRVLVTAHSKELKAQGYTASTANMSSAYLVGLLLANKAKKKNIAHAIVDLGLYRKNLRSRLFAVVKGTKDGGLDVPADAKSLPEDSRVTGEHIAAFAKSLKTDKPEQYKKQFSKYIKDNNDPEQITTQVNTVKQKLVG